MNPTSTIASSLPSCASTAAAICQGRAALPCVFFWPAFCVSIRFSPAGCTLTASVAPKPDCCRDAVKSAWWAASIVAKDWAGAWDDSWKPYIPVFSTAHSSTRNCTFSPLHDDGDDLRRSRRVQTSQTISISSLPPRHATLRNDPAAAVFAGRSPISGSIVSCSGPCWS